MDRQWVVHADMTMPTVLNWVLELHFVHIVVVIRVLRGFLFVSLENLGANFDRILQLETLCQECFGPHLRRLLLFFTNFNLIYRVLSLPVLFNSQRGNLLTFAVNLVLVIAILVDWSRIS